MPTSLTLVELAAAIRDRRLSSREVVQAHFERIRAHASLNALVTLDEEGALERARAADEALARGELWGPLHGVPFTLKDMHETAGLRTSAGLVELADHVPARDGAATERLRDAGGILLGKTNMAMNIESDNELHGRPLNPYARGRSAGGSSGGAAAALAARLTPLDVGTDLSGSIRMPAHFCGVVGHKPTLHRIPTAGLIWLPGATMRADRWLGVSGPMARTVDDAALAFGVLAGAHLGDPEVAPVPVGPIPQRRPDSLRLRWSPVVEGIAQSRAVSAALAHVVEELRAAGAAVEESLPPFPFEQVLTAYRRLIRAPLSAMASAAPPGSSHLATQPLSAREMLEALDERDALFRALEDFLAGWDAWLCPAASMEAFPHRAKGEPVALDDDVVSSQTVDHFCVAATYTGAPSIVVPIALAGGLPIGAQLIGRRWQDEALFGTARAVVEVAGRLPPPDLTAD